MIDAFMVGTKNYDMDWYLRYGFSYTRAAKTLREWGFSFILTQSRDLPMPDSAVPSEVRTEMDALYASYDDLKFREALAKEGIAYWPTLCTFFDPKALQENPGLRPIAQDGSSMEMVDWYMGINPACQEFVDQQVAKVVYTVKKLEPDGIFLSFIRWPGFWERWMPQHARHDFPEYSYDVKTIERFLKETNLKLPGGLILGDEVHQISSVAGWIESHARAAWTDWKCNLITQVVRQVRQAAQAIHPGIKIMINTLPFGEQDYENARDLTFGQRLESLSEVVDIFEVMTYHQILKRTVDWIPKIGREVKRRTGKQTICTLQVEPLYLDGIHKVDGRSPAIPSAEFSRAINAVEAENVDGVVVFVWSDLLKKAILSNDRTRIDALQSAIQKRHSRRSSI